MAEEPTSSDTLLTEDQQFQRVLQLFPIVRSRDYCEDDETNVTTTRENEHSAEFQECFGDPSEQAKGVCQVAETKLEEQDNEGLFWALLNTAAEQKLGRGDAQRFCDAFKKVHTELVYKTLTLEGIELAAKNWDLQTNVST
ncbi:hypothetical protein O6H91_19G055400 [Diphasiastrum complanatum]|uniref:Uncharacterized protein n=1 Tax=Diphasiastrum complanatum TaxID=34168 RepID=A0ACC2AV87_DIPCM|nr:hypothetical protein O6H91_19G055400 [Diphasiastrum complanatum]